MEGAVERREGVVAAVDLKNSGTLFPWYLAFFPFLCLCLWIIVVALIPAILFAFGAFGFTSSFSSCAFDLDISVMYSTHIFYRLANCKCTMSQLHTDGPKAEWIAGGKIN